MATVSPTLPLIPMLPAQSHKGQNGKVLIIGGSDLFHAAGQWAAQVASTVVDMVFYSSTAENNLLIQQRKKDFNDGVVVRRKDIPHYVEEADVVLIGPGMRRDFATRWQGQVPELENLTLEEWENDTYAVCAALWARWPEKKWVIDAGALQVATQEIVPRGALFTPHEREFQDLRQRVDLDAHVVLRKNIVDTVGPYTIEGGNAGLTKGGSGDALAGLAAALWTRMPATEAAAWASFLVKQTAEDLYLTQNTFFTTSDLVHQLPRTLTRIILPQ